MSKSLSPSPGAPEGPKDPLPTGKAKAVGAGPENVPDEDEDASPFATGQSVPLLFRSREELPQIQGHRLVRELGRGGMGVVYLARELNLGREVAVKVIARGLAPHQLKRFREEAALTGQLQHPAIVPIYQVGQTAEGLDYYTMKRVQGKTLGQIIKKLRTAPQGGQGVLSLKRRAAIMLKVCEGVAFAHDRGVIHRDLKPGNIMLGEYGEVYVLDWGIAKALFGPANPPMAEGMQRAGHSASWCGEAAEASGDGSPSGHGTTPSGPTITGTPSYMSPEQARGESRAVDQRSDVWSLGGILYALLTLSPPISGATPSERLCNAAQGLVTPLANCPGGQNATPPLRAILERALQVQPDRRYASAREMAGELGSYLDGKGGWQAAYEWEPTEQDVELGQWQTTAGTWSIDSAGLFPVQCNDLGAVLLHPKRFFGDVRVEITARILKEGNVRPGEVSVLLSVPEPGVGINETDGYCLHYGSDGFTSVKLARNDIDVLYHPLEGASQAGNVALAFERVGDRIRLEAGGKEVFVYQDLLPLGGCRVGLYGWYSNVRILSVRIFTRGLDTQVSCLAVPDHDFERGRFAEALSGYRQIAEALAGREEGHLARFRAGLSRMRAQDPFGAESEFQQLDGTPGETLAQLGRAMILAHDGDHCRELMRLGTAWRVSKGTPAQPFVQAQLWTRATECRQEGNIQAQAQFLKEVLRCEPPESPRRKIARSQLCQALVRLDNPVEALEVLGGLKEQVGVGDSALQAALRSLIGLYCDRAEWSQALELAGRFEASGQGHQAGPNPMRIEWLRGNLAGLASLLEQARAKPGQAGAGVLNYWGAMLALDQGRLRNAQQLLRLNLEGRNQLDSQAASTHAWIYCMRGMPERTMAAFARHLNPADSARRMQVLSEVAELARLRGELSSAQDYLRQILDHLPRTRLIELAPVCCLRLGLTCFEKGDRRGGYASLQEALERDERIGGQAQVMAPARAMLQWDEGGPLAEPPEPGQLCPFSQRARYFLLLGEFARGNLRREDALRAYRRAILESPTPYRYAAWLAAMRLGELGVELSSNSPLWPSLKSGTPNASEM